MFGLHIDVKLMKIRFAKRMPDKNCFSHPALQLDCLTEYFITKHQNCPGVNPINRVTY